MFSNFVFFSLYTCPFCSHSLVLRLFLPSLSLCRFLPPFYTGRCITHYILPPCSKQAHVPSSSRQRDFSSVRLSVAFRNERTFSLSSVGYIIFRRRVQVPFLFLFLLLFLVRLFRLLVSRLFVTCLARSFYFSPREA